MEITRNHRADFHISMSWMTPSLQYVVRPTGERAIRNVLVFGTELSVGS